jgi:hypothetical protein
MLYKEDKLIISSAVFKMTIRRKVKQNKQTSHSLEIL